MLMQAYHFISNVTYIYVYIKTQFIEGSGLLKSHPSRSVPTKGGKPTPKYNTKSQVSLFSSKATEASKANVLSYPLGKILSKLPALPGAATRCQRAIEKN